MSLSPQLVEALASGQMEILDLRHFSARQLRPLLLEEAARWEDRLEWDYRSSIELLLQYLDSRVLPGLVATVRGKICGYTFCVHEGNKAVVGDVYVHRATDDAATVRNTLLMHLLETIDATPGIDRVESQLLLYDTGELKVPFNRQGFVPYRRLYQRFDLNAVPSVAAAIRSTFELRPWITSAYQPVAELIHAAYAGHLDAEINDQYRTLHGTLRFLHNIIRFPGCGTFDPESSLLVRDRRTDALAGVLLCSRIAPTVAHLTQLCVAPDYRGSGLGRALLARALQELPGRGYKRVTLTVSEGNRPALRLYEEFGFATRQKFDAMVREPGRETAIHLEASDGPPAGAGRGSRV